MDSKTISINRSKSMRASNASANLSSERCSLVIRAGNRDWQEYRKQVSATASTVAFEESAPAMTASTQEGTYHPIGGRSSDSLLFLALSAFSSTNGTMAHESSDSRNTKLQSSIQRPDRPGISPEFPVHPISQQQNGSPPTARKFSRNRPSVN